MLALLTTLALATPPDGYAEVKKGSDCTIYKGPADDDGVNPMIAECHWAEVDPDGLIGKLSDYGAFDDLIFGVERSEVERVEGDRSLVHQVQSTKGIATREVLIWMSTSVGERATTIAWRTASDEDLVVSDGNVRAPRNDGAWEVGPHPDGGARIVHRIAYDPGGNVPGWVVRWFQVGGMLQVMTEVRAAATSNPSE